jgi:hypothetical protein
LVEQLFAVASLISGAAEICRTGGAGWPALTWKVFVVRILLSERLPVDSAVTMVTMSLPLVGEDHLEPMASGL